MKIAAIATIALGLASLSPSSRAENHYYLVDAIAAQSDDVADRAQARELEVIYGDLQRASGVDAKLVYSTNPDINAFATEIGDEKIVIVQEGLLQNMRGDRDAVAAVLGHELAHHKADHIRAGKRKQNGVRVLGVLLGAVIGAKVGRNSGAAAGALSGAAVGVGANLIALKFNRNQEMEADRLSLGWMIAAGYNPQGMLRLQQRLDEMPGARRSAMFSTHPTSAKRYQAASRQIARLAPPPELLAKVAAPLVSDQTLADSRAAIEQARDARISEVLQRDIAAPSASALAPIDGVNLATYAEIANQLTRVGAHGKAKVLASHKLNDARFAVLSHGYAARMREDPTLKQRYSAEFFRASQGQFAEHGRDLADSYALGQPLRLDPPYPLETARKLYQAMSARGAPNLDEAQRAAAEAELLGPLGLNYYDYLIAHNWWARRASTAALAGDSSLVQAYLSDEALDDESAAAVAQSSGVHIGNNVHIGKSVQIGQGDRAHEAAPAADHDADSH